MTTDQNKQQERNTAMTPPGVARLGQTVEEIAPGVLFFPYFGTSIAFLTSEGVVLFDTSTRMAGRRVLEELRKRTDLPVHTIVYSHGHLDHAGGGVHFIEEAQRLGRPKPRVIAHH